MNKRLEEQLKKSQEKVAAIQAQIKEEKQRAYKAANPPKKRGKKPLSDEILITAIQLAETKPILHVAMKLNISKSVLYKYGISKKALNAKVA